ncbi:MAG TPA: 3-dehydroquinate synthase, partial [Fimbriimonas sp.]
RLLIVLHSVGSYPVDFLRIDQIAEQLPERSYIVTDKNVERLYGDRFEGFPRFAIEPGESSKGLDTFGQVVGWLAEAGANRKSTVVALGGGVVGDLAGFVAASYMRGVRFVQVPTTLLAQVDSSVGGKVGVDLPQGKNLVGAFAPPEFVYVPTDALKTLTEREFRSGMAEVVKYGLIMDPNLASVLSRAALTLEEMQPIVEACIRHKANVVAEDEYETKGLRAILNFGHTVGHAIEQAAGYGTLLHGEAIAVGMRVEAELGEAIGVTPKGTASEVVACLENQGLQTRLERRLDKEMLLRAMRKDKKATDGGLPFSLLTSIGSCKLYTDVAEEAVLPLLDDL